MVLSCGFALFRGQKIVKKHEKKRFFFLNGIFCIYFGLARRDVRGEFSRSGRKHRRGSKTALRQLLWEFAFYANSTFGFSACTRRGVLRGKIPEVIAASR
jgi:hypothetical protein